jgi:tetratricopeptide (TPR) repeat protein
MTVLEKKMRHLITIVLLLFLTGCASTPPARVPLPDDLFADAAFKQPSRPIVTTDLFALSPDMREYLRSPGFNALLRSKGKEQGLVDALYTKGELRLEYESMLTRDASQTFRDRIGNCLSLVIMTAAFAKELDMSVRFQSVDMESWTRSDNVLLLSGHVNIMLGARSASPLRETNIEQDLLVDFIPGPKVDSYRMHPLSEQDIITMFMNNRAAEAMVDGRLDDAYWWARKAVADNPRTAMAFNTLGVIYERHGDKPRAERAYRAALAREPENLITLRNLQPVLAALGKNAEAQAISQTLARLDPIPPFQDFRRGIDAYWKGEFAVSRDLFQREVRRDPYNDEFHFWLAASYMKLGDVSGARRELALAVDNSVQGETRKRYSAKLAHLRQLGMR